MLKLQTCVENAFFHHISSAERNTLCEHGLGGSFVETLAPHRLDSTFCFYIKSKVF